MICVLLLWFDAVWLFVFSAYVWVSYSLNGDTDTFLANSVVDGGEGGRGVVSDVMSHADVL